MADETLDLSGAYTTDEQEKASKEETAPKTKVAQGPTVDLSGHYGTEDKPAQQATEEAMPVGEVHAAPSAWQSFKGAVTHPVEYLGDVKSDVEQGGGRTVVGRTLGHMQARGDQGYQAPQPPAPEVTAPRPQTEPGGHIPIMAGMVQGPPKLARGLARIGKAESEVTEKPIGETGKELASAGTEAAGGAMQTLGPALISPTALPRVVGGMLVGGLAEKGLKKIGVPEEYAGLGGTVAGLAAAGAPEIAEAKLPSRAIRAVGRAGQVVAPHVPGAAAVLGAVSGVEGGPASMYFRGKGAGYAGRYIAEPFEKAANKMATYDLPINEKNAQLLGVDAKKADKALAKAVDEHSKYAASEARGPIDPETNPAYKKSVESVRKAQEAAAEAHYHWNEAKDAAARAKTATVEVPAPAVEAPMALTPEQEAAQAARVPKEPVVPAEKAPEVAPEPKAVPEAPKTPLGQITPPEKPAEKPGRLGTLRVGEGGKVVDTEPEVQQKIEEGLQRGTAEAKPIALKPLGVREQEALGKIKLAPEVPEVTEVTGKKLGVPTGPVEDIGAKVRAGEKAVPRTGEERRARVRTPEEEQTTRLFKQARTELGEEASSDEVMARVDDLKAAEAKPAKGAETNPEDLSKVEAVIKDHTDQDLARLGKKYGVNEADYDFSKRDEKRHRVERDQFVKDLIAKIPPEDVTNISGLASKFDNRTDTGTWTEAERSGLSKAQRARAIMQEHVEGAKEAPAAEVKKAEAVPEETKEEPPKAEDIDKKVADVHNEEGGSSLHDEKGDLKGKEGYAFSPSKSLEKVAEGTKLTPEDIKEYRERPEVQEALKKDPNAFVGTWESGGKSYMDVSTFETDLEKAKELGKQNEQKAIYDLKNGKEIPLEETKEAESKPKTTEAKPAQYDEAVRLVTEAGKGSTKDLREGLGISQGEAIKLIDRMESEGVVGPAEGAGPREVTKTLPKEKLEVGDTFVDETGEPRRITAIEGDKIRTADGTLRTYDSTIKLLGDLNNSKARLAEGGKFHEVDNGEPFDLGSNVPRYFPEQVFGKAWKRAEDILASIEKKFGEKTTDKFETSFIERNVEGNPESADFKSSVAQRKLWYENLEKEANEFLNSDGKTIKSPSNKVFYHGSSKEGLKSLLKSGIDPKYAGESQGSISVREGKRQVYVSRDMEEAKTYADGLVLELDAPYDLHSKFYRDDIGDEMYDRKIDPKYISAYYTEDSDGEWSRHEISKKQQASKSLPTGDALIKKYGESSGDPADTTFILKDGRGVANTGTDHDIMLGGKATDKLPPREQFVAEGNIRVRPRQGTIGGREVSLSIPEAGITPKQLAYVKKMAPQLGSGAVMIEVGKPGGDYRVLSYGDATPENLEKTLRELGPVRPEGYPPEKTTVSGGSQAATAEAKEGEVKLPELAEKHLTPEERAGVLKSKAQTEKFVQQMEKIPDVQEYTDIALAGEGARKWYQRSTRAFDALLEESPDYFKDGDRDKFINLMAASSPRQSVAMNLRETLRTWKAYVDAGRPEGKELKSLLDENLTPAKSKTPNALKAINGEEMWPDLTKNKNFKVPSFAKNLRGWLGAVTSDGWMSLFAGLDPREISSPHSYHPLSVATRAAAEALGWEPAEAQAAIWSFTQALTERGEELPEEVRKHSEDFVDLLKNDPEVRGLLADLGVSHENLDRKLEAIGEKPEVSGRTTASTSRSIGKLKERIETARGKGTIPPPKSAQGELGFREEHPVRNKPVEDEDVSFEPEEFGPRKKNPLGRIGNK